MTARARRNSISDRRRSPANRSLQPAGGENEGWLISQVLDGESGKTFFAVLDAQRVEDGPVAKIWLDHHLPISFHGAWKAA